MNRAVVAAVFALMASGVLADTVPIGPFSEVAEKIGGVQGCVGSTTIRGVSNDSMFICSPVNRTMSVIGQNGVVTTFDHVKEPDVQSVCHVLGLQNNDCNKLKIAIISDETYIKASNKCPPKNVLVSYGRITVVSSGHWSRYYKNSVCDR